MSFPDLIPDSVTWGGILLTVAILVAGWILSGFARRGVLAVMSRVRGITPTVAAVTARIVGYFIILIAVGTALALMGANIQPLLAIVIVVAVVLALVLRGVADNFAAGVLIQSRRTVNVGEEIHVDGPDGLLIGRVLELNARAVVIVTNDGRTVHVPNARLLSDCVVNASRHGARRSDIQVRVAATGRPVNEISALIADAAAAVDGVHSREPVRTLVLQIDPARIVFRVQFWHHPLHGTPLASEVVVAISQALSREDLVASVTSLRVDPPLTRPGPV